MARRRRQMDIEDVKIGHNSNLSGEERERLSGFVSEIERVDQQVCDLTSERGGIYKRAKEQGFDTKALKHVLKLRRMESAQRSAFENSVDAYTSALGMLAGTPLGDAAVSREFGERTA